MREGTVSIPNPSTSGTETCITAAKTVTTDSQSTCGPVLSAKAENIGNIDAAANCWHRDCQVHLRPGFMGGPERLEPASHPRIAVREFELGARAGRQGQAVPRLWPKPPLNAARRRCLPKERPHCCAKQLHDRISANTLLSPLAATSARMQNEQMSSTAAAGHLEGDVVDGHCDLGVPELTPRLVNVLRSSKQRLS